MYIIKRFLSERFERINNILTQFSSAQNSNINLLACVSYIFPEVMQAMQYPLCTIPTEGVVSKRYFPISQYMDDIENLAEELTLKIFNIQSDYKVTIQPHSGTQANHIVYSSIIKAGDTVLALKPADGGHISHSKIFNGQTLVNYYSLSENNEIDYYDLENSIKSLKPKLLIVGGSSYPREINYKKIFEITRSHQIYIMADISHTALFIAGKIHQDIFPYVDFATFTMEKNLRGPHGGIVIYRKMFHNQLINSIFPLVQGSPLQNMLFAKLVALHKLDSIDLEHYASSVVKNANLIVNELRAKNIDVITNGTDSHIVLIDVGKIGRNGCEVEKDMEEHKILVNRNLIPNDIKKPLVTSGIRIGSCGITNLGYSQRDIKALSKILTSIILKKHVNTTTLKKIILKYHSNINH